MVIGEIFSSVQNFANSVDTGRSKTRPETPKVLMTTENIMQKKKKKMRN